MEIPVSNVLINIIFSLQVTRAVLNTHAHRATVTSAGLIPRDVNNVKKIQ